MLNFIKLKNKRCRSGFATPTETFEGLNNFQNESDGVVNPITPQLDITKKWFA